MERIQSQITFVSGEVLTTVGSGVQLCTLLFPSHMFLLLAASGNVAKSISWALWGATHTCFIRNFALSNNVGDLTAKSDAQGAFALITGWLSGVAAISFSHSAPFLFSLFACLAPLHAMATWRLLRSAEFEILNESKVGYFCVVLTNIPSLSLLQSPFSPLRTLCTSSLTSLQATLIIRHYLKTGTIASMVELKPYEKLFGESIKDTEGIPQMELGSTIDQAFDTAGEIQNALTALRVERRIHFYLIHCRGKITCLEFVAICFESSFTGKQMVMEQTNAPVLTPPGQDSLKALLNVMKFYESIATSSITPDRWSLENGDVVKLLEESHHWTVDNFPAFVAKLDAMVSSYR